MFPYIGADSGITLTRTDIEAPLLIKATGYTYAIQEDQYDIGFEVTITDPTGREIPTDWTIYSYTDAMLKVFGEIAARQSLPGAESQLMSYVGNHYNSAGVAEQKILSHTRTATARLALVKDMIARLLEEYQASFDETSQAEI
ncbi:hypothetical protein IGS68_33490 (plasmid) [Skermanella sp. TT6]|uniref:DUF1828 domain-containing protein n=1 Tax=Skermanella cutis TaxID=2775420 RepID=A0ABX7BGK9_9PROT|nr:hypothetical protein [Skermanella sp. TT6]QQP93536.1 hypothetical protein IGS68_33490 [Skermanella sp. TT6]